MNRFLVLSVLWFHSLFLFSQTTDSLVIDNLFASALRSAVGLKNLEQLCKETPHRLAGSAGSAKAIEILVRQLREIHPDTLYLQEVITKPWDRAEKEIAYLKSSNTGKVSLEALSLGGSVGTPASGILANMVEVQTFDELKKLGKDNIKGRIVFFNFAMDPGLFSPFQAYSKSAFQRVSGATEAARYGAVGVVIRSLSNNLNRFPHTGIMHYNDSIPKIPAIAISTLDAEKVSQILKKEPSLEFFFKTNSKSLPDVKSYNIIAEFRGIEKPKEIITVGGHTDCWDVGEGANDDGVGCIQSMEVARLFRQLKITTKRTIRVVLFIDEEMNQTGAKAYAKSVKENGEVIYAALESDSGAGVARGFGCSASDDKFQKFQALEKYFDQYGITQFYKGGGGVDIGPLRQFGVPLLNLHPDPQRYFDYHHSANDTFENISNREMQTGSAAMASLIFLIDKYNLF